eukprot:m.31132 g.31132  ORF g.31132 m.31132 type:complete len:193 (-) comp12037_c0_seq1:1555-2133(-)
MDLTEDTQVKPLFGGALSCELPSRFTDISAFRQLPDTQEVFADAVTDQSIIIEILELAEESEANSAAEFHFHSLANDNDAFESKLEQPVVSSDLPQEGVKSVCMGLQQVSKFNESADKANTVRIFVCCLRYPNVTTDIVITLNAPTAVSNTSSSAEAIDAQAAEAVSSLEATKALFDHVVESFKVLDWDLFC